MAAFYRTRLRDSDTCQAKQRTEIGRQREQTNKAVSAPEPAEPFLLGYTKWELLAQRVVPNTREFTEFGMDVLWAHADALLLIELQSLRSNRDRKLFVVGCADYSVSFNSTAEEHHRADRPVVLPIA